MPFDKPLIQSSSNPYRNDLNIITDTRTIYYGEVISIDDETDGGRIKVRIQGLDTKLTNDNLPWCYPFIPKFIHLYPQVGEVVRILIEDIKYPQRSRYWVGSVISQPQKIGFDSFYTALSTTNLGFSSPEPAAITNPNSTGVFPLKTDVAIVGKVNTDVILRINELHLRAGKHMDGDIMTLNTLNPAEISLNFEVMSDKTNYQSNTVVMSDKIALISHTGIPKFKAANLNTNDREKIFNEGHPIPRGDVLVQALEIIRTAIIAHLHGYSNLSADKDSVITALEKIDFSVILQNNIVIN